jgi:hypothetical protein
LFNRTVESDERPAQTFATRKGVFAKKHTHTDTHTQTHRHPHTRPFASRSGASKSEELWAPSNVPSCVFI